MRVYIPVTFEELCEPELQVKTGIAVTKNFCEQYGEENDLEFLEDCAFTQANILAFINLRNNNTKIKARFIVSSELNYASINEDLEIPGKVELKEPLPWEKIVCLHAEDIEDLQSITNLLDQDLDEALEKLDIMPLLWFDKSELSSVINLFTE